MQRSVRRAAAFAVVGTFALPATVVDPPLLAAVPFALIAVVGRLVSGGPAFELFARPEDRLEGQLRGLVAFSLVATGLALLTSLTGLPASVFVASVLLVAFGNLTETVVCERRDTPLRRATGFGVGGAAAAFAGQVLVPAAAGVPIDAALAAFLAVSGALVGAVLRASLLGKDDPAVMASAALALWVLASLGIEVDPVGLVVALAVAGAMGYLAWLLGTASVTGMLTGVFMGLVTIVLGGFGWFVALIAFFGIGGFASKYRYEEKRELGVAEANEGARGTRNVLANAAVAVLAVVGFAASPRLAADAGVFVLAFAGSLATAMSDTLSSELGVLYGDPKLITSLERVRPGTDGGVTLEGSLAGAAGALAVAVIALALLGLTPVGAGLVVVGGVVGMTVDSLLGAAVEGRGLGNQSVNFLATLSGAVFTVGAGVALGLVAV